MKCLSLVLNVIFAVVLHAWKDHYGNERDIFIMEDGGKTFLLLLDGKVHLAPDNTTVELLNAKHNENLNISTYQRGEPLSSLAMSYNTPDEVMRVTITRILYLSYPIEWLSTHELGPMINPSIVKWHNQTIICYKTHLESQMVVRSMDNPLTPSSLQFQTGRNCSTNDHEESWHMTGEDARMMVLPDGRLQFIYSSHNEWNYRMYRTSAAYDPVTRHISFDAQQWFTVMKGGYIPKHWGNHQKNWVPFLHDGKVLYIQNINPLHVMETVDEGIPYQGQPGCGVPSNLSLANQSSCYARTVSQAPPIDWRWDYGQPRGGSPGILLPDGKLYFALFHTRHHIPNNMLETYFMGAITWYLNDTTFHIHSISHVPIVNVSFYAGRWTPHRSGSSKMDYVVFPLSLLLHDDNSSITISVGRQDCVGTVFTVTLASVLNGMRCIQC